ncbi:MAG TPA: DUF4189 domain-containing protein [Gemmataceae bacterium]|jgi:hypothetical protein
MRTVCTRRELLAGAAAISPLLFAGPLAYAEDSEDYYCAIAFSQATGSVGSAWGHRSRAAAERAALAYCSGRDARVVVWARNAWAALVVGARRGYGFATGTDSGRVIGQAFEKANQIDRNTYLASFVHSSPLAPIFYNYDAIPDDWGRREIVRKAMGLLHNRFRDLIVGQNVYAVLRGGAFIAPGILDKHGMGADEGSQNALLWHQLHHLRLAGGRFPRVVFKTADYDNVAWAWGKLGLVTVKNAANVEGEFEVQVSLRHLGGGGNQSDAVNWASIIAHEMLHNLGHRHELDNYTDNRQINVFQKAVYHNGAYKRGLVCPGFV